MAIKLVVTNLFADFAIGQEITDPALVAQYAESHPSYVVRVWADDPPADQTAKKPKPDA